MRKSSNRGEIITILTIGTFLVLGISTLLSATILKDKTPTQTSKAAASYTRYPDVSAPAGYYWEADINTWCDRSSICPKNDTAHAYPDNGYVADESSNYCYGFEQGNPASYRCMMLHNQQYYPKNGTTPTPLPSVSPSCNDAVKEVRFDKTTRTCYVETDGNTDQIGCYVRNPGQTEGRGCQYLTIRTINGKTNVLFNCNNVDPFPHNNSLQIAGLKYQSCQVNNVIDWSKAKFWSSIDDAPVSPEGAVATPTPTRTPTPMPTATPVPASGGGSSGGGSTGGGTTGGGSTGGGTTGGTTGATQINCPDYTNISSNNYSACVVKDGCGVLETVGISFKCVSGTEIGPAPAVLPVCANQDPQHPYKWHWYNTDYLHTPVALCNVSSTYAQENELCYSGKSCDPDPGKNLECKGATSSMTAGYCTKRAPVTSYSQENQACYPGKSCDPDPAKNLECKGTTSSTTVGYCSKRATVISYSQENQACSSSKPCDPDAAKNLECKGATSATTGGVCTKKAPVTSYAQENEACDVRKSCDPDPTKNLECKGAGTSSITGGVCTKRVTNTEVGNKKISGTITINNRDTSKTYFLYTGAYGSDLKLSYSLWGDSIKANTMLWQGESRQDPFDAYVGACLTPTNGDFKCEDKNAQLNLIKTIRKIGDTKIDFIFEQKAGSSTPQTACVDKDNKNVAVHTQYCLNNTKMVCDGTLGASAIGDPCGDGTECRVVTNNGQSVAKCMSLRPDWRRVAPESFFVLKQLDFPKDASLDEIKKDLRVHITRYSHNTNFGQCNYNTWADELWSQDANLEEREVDGKQIYVFVMKDLPYADTSDGKTPCYYHYHGTVQYQVESSNSPGKYAKDIHTINEFKFDARDPDAPYIYIDDINLIGYIQEFTLSVKNGTDRGMQLDKIEVKNRDNDNIWTKNKIFNLDPNPWAYITKDTPESESTQKFIIYGWEDPVQKAILSGWWADSLDPISKTLVRTQTEGDTVFSLIEN